MQIGRIGEDQIVTSGTPGNILKYIPPVWINPGDIQLPDRLVYESVRLKIRFHKVDGHASPRSEFEAYASGTGKKIEGNDFIEIIIIGKDIEHALFGKIGSRPGFKIFMNLDTPSLVFTAYYSQL